MVGILGKAAAIAYAATGNDAARSVLMDSVAWLYKVGYRSSTRGLYYGRRYPPCEPSPDTAPNCSFGPATDPAVVASDRYLNGEVIGAISEAYRVSGFSWLKDFGDNLTSATFGKAGGPGTDGRYVNELDETVQMNKAKNFGFFFGFGDSPSWLAARVSR
jgi:hypothetical protein